MGRDRDKFRKFESGSQKLKEKFMKCQTGVFQKFLKPSKENNPNTVELQCKIDVPLLPTSTSSLNENENYSVLSLDYEQEMSRNINVNINYEQGITINSNFNKMMKFFKISNGLVI